ncbi:MAG TPA: elongation factor 1-beta, partial [Nitrososphaeria archaeon]|nr:elongation factor 1-beta [Nitrososphaeria archaeon]
MARVIIVTELMPEDPSTDLNELIGKIRQSLPEGFELKDFETKPVAFGLSLIKAMFVVPEQEGASETLEKILNRFDEIQEV